MKPPRRILVIALRRLGDLLLATPLIHALREQWPEALIDVLVAAGTEAVLEGNPDVAHVIPFRRGRGGLSLLCSITRRYALAVNLQPEDRGHFFALLAAPRRVSIVPPQGQPGWRWKRWLSWRAVPVDLHQTHAVIQYLQLADALGIARQFRIVPPRALHGEPDPLQPEERVRLARRYAVIHPSPMYPYKAWTVDGWQSAIRQLLAQGLTVVVSGGPGADERRAVDAVLETLGAANGRLIDLCGRLSLAELAGLLERATVFIGPDTAVTHLAAACGTPTVALFGPSNPMAWGPWPQDWQAQAGSPWQFRGAWQQHGKIWLLQGTHARRPGCIPCLAEGCEQRRDSRSDCLEFLPAAVVTAAVDAALSAHLQ